MILAYRGDDLALTTGRARTSPRDVLIEQTPAGPEWLGSALEEAEADGEEVWVDATVLKCCNQAYELAVAHRSPEVRLEHLVHAMTLVPPAIDALRREHISDATLRRESGIIIAHEIPSVSANGHFAPETSEEMELVLRHAAGHAYAHRSPVTIEDILRTLFDMTRDNPTRSLLSRHRSDWTIRDAAGETARRYYEPPRERSRPQPPPPPDYTSGRGDVPSEIDTYQDSRIDALERAVRDLTSALRADAPSASEPQVAPPQPSGPPQPSAQPMPAANGVSDAMLLERVGAVEASVEGKFRELARTWNVLGDRLQTVEDLLLDADGRAANGDGVGREDFDHLSRSVERLRSLETLPQRLERIERLAGNLDRIEQFSAKLDRIEQFSGKLDRVEQLATRLDRLDQISSKLDRLDRLDGIEALDRKIGDVERGFTRLMSRFEELDERMDDAAAGGVDLSPIREQLDALSRAVAHRPSMQAEMAPLQNRIESLARMVSSHGTGGEADLTPVMQRLDRLERTIEERPVSGVDTAPLFDRFKELESKVGDSVLMAEDLGSRIDGFEGAVDATRAQISQVATSLTNEIKSVSGALSAQHAANERMHTMVSTGLRSMQTAGVDPEAVAGAVRQPVEQALANIRALVEADRGDQRKQFEYIVNGLAKSADDHRKDLSEVHDAMLKLNGNQQTLAQSMDRWRLDVSGDIGVLGSRLNNLEQRIEGMSVNAQDPRIEELTQRIHQVSTVIERKEQRRSGFLMWMFGTEDWWSDGWRTPEEREAVQQEQAARIYQVETGNVIRPEDRRLHG